jgi:ADP-heptose:LPS heptosyltransferase
MVIKKALTFRASSIGDCLMAKYFLENVHAKYPDARCGIVVASRSAMIKDLLAGSEWIEIIEVNRKDIQGLILLWKNWHGSDVVLTQYAGKVGGTFSLATKIVARILAKTGGLIGFADAAKNTRFLYDHLLPFTGTVAIAELERMALRAANVEVSIPFPQIVKTPSSLNREVRSRFNLTEKPYVIIHLFSGADNRGLSPEKKKELISVLYKRFGDSYTLVLSGTQSEQLALQEAAGNTPVVFLAGKASLQDLMKLIVESSGVISLDTGVGHIAAHLGAPLVILRTCLGKTWWIPEQYGPTIPTAVFGQDEACAEGHEMKPFPRCLNEINLEEVGQRALDSVRFTP